MFIAVYVLASSNIISLTSPPNMAAKRKSASKQSKTHAPHKNKNNKQKNTTTQTVPAAQDHTNWRRFNTLASISCSIVVALYISSYLRPLNMGKSTENPAKHVSRQRRWNVSCSSQVAFEYN